jgi:outer membrane receptor protein involved in Fe transport
MRLPSETRSRSAVSAPTPSRGRSIQSRFAFLDVGTLEVVRGPQGTLFGKNTVAGALNISSGRPTRDLSASLAATYEFRNQETDLTGFVSGPVTDWLRVRAAGQFSQLNRGWVYNSGYDEHLPESQSLAFRFSAEADLASNLTLYVKYEHGFYKIDGQPYEIGYLYDGPLSALTASAQFITNAIRATGETGKIDLRTNIRNTGPADLGSAFLMDGTNDEAMARLDWSVGPGTLTGILANSKYYYKRSLDSDNGPLTLLSTREIEYYDQDSAELRYASDKIGPLSLLAGFYWQRSNLSYGDPETGLLGDFAAVGLAVPPFLRTATFTQKAETLSGFGQLSFELTPTLTVTGGARYNSETKRARQAVDFVDMQGVPVTGALRATYQALVQSVAHDIPLYVKESDWTYAANLRWEATPEAMFYASFSTGVKGGGFNANYFGTTAQTATETDDQFQARMIKEATFRPERAKAWEIGTKLSPSRSLQLNLAAFYSKFKDLQVSQFTGGTTFVVGNAAAAKSYGVEFDGRWKVTPDLELFGNLAWLHFEFTDYFTAGCTALQSIPYGGNVAACSAAGGNDLTGRPNQNAPEWTGTVGFQYAREMGDGLELRLRADTNYVSEYYGAGDLDPKTMQTAFAKVNASIGLASRQGWEISLIGRNLTDKLTFADANDLPLATGTMRVAVQRPRTIALRLKAAF